MVANYIVGVGRLSTDRYDFQNHIEGNPPHHNAGIITLSPPVTINSVEHTTVQGAITELAPFAVTIPDASESVKGIVQLAGDLSGTSTDVKASASSIQGRPVIGTAPTTGHFLKWNGTYWGGAALPTQIIVPAGDLSGTGSTSTNPTINTLTGYDGTVTILCRGFLFFDNVVDPIITQWATSSNGKTLTIASQTSLDNIGGALALKSGFGLTKSGPISLSIFETTLLHISQPAAGSYVTAFNAEISSTEMPTGTGSKVIYIGDATTNPTTGSPVGGTILYSNATTGSLWVKEAGGATYELSGNPIVLFANNTAENSYDTDMDVWSPIYSTSSLSYDYSTSTFRVNGSVQVQTGDIIKIHLSGFVGNDGSSYEGYIKLVLLGYSQCYEIPGTECYLSDTPVQHFSMSASYVITSLESGDIISAQIAMKNETTGTIEFYGAAHISMEVIRPT